ncbi:glycosyltransferase family 61 protein [Pedobacter antarcticus]|uniref:glycosyltransferase family 61 protein n=1 Tax=Pedobacter antarcticus TaxID=34086 RepID=UPI00292D2188|nr:glycosyltransferase family 61 protein [Pedobacter antarcticus]
MEKKVTVPYPLNICDEDRDKYLPHLSYTLNEQRVKYLKNVFVTSSGFCMNNKGLIKESHHNYPVQINDYRNEAAKCYYDAVDNPENLIVLDDDKTYLAIHHPWFNYYHWICESIFRLWMVRKKLDTLILILPEYYRDADFIMGSIEPFNIKNIFFVPNGKSLLVKNLCLPQIKPECDSYNGMHVRQIRRFYSNYVLTVKPLITNRVERLYVSRKLAGRRAITNEDEILTIIEKYNFEIFYPEKHSFLEQVAIFSRVRYLVGTHGSGLTNMLFMGSGTSLLELHKNKTNDLDHSSPLFWYMAEALGIKYYHQLCDTHGREDYFEGDYIIDARNFEKNLLKMLND